MPVPSEEVDLNFLDKVYDAFKTTRTYANRLLIAQVIAALLLAVAPGYVIGRVRYLVGLSVELSRLYRELGTDVDELEKRGVFVFEAPPLIAEAALAGSRLSAFPVFRRITGRDVGAAERANRP